MARQSSNSVHLASGEEKAEEFPAGSKSLQRTATERSLLARQGAYTLHSRYDSRELTKNARAKFLDGFLDEVDPSRELSEPERLRRAEYARKAYFTKLARKSAAARSARKAAS